jgi:hypothetical protein
LYLFNLPLSGLWDQVGKERRPEPKPFCRPQGGGAGLDAGFADEHCPGGIAWRSFLVTGKEAFEKCIAEKSVSILVFFC